MRIAFSFFLRLFLCLVAARFILQAIGMESRNFLIGLTIILLANVYWFSYLVFRDRTPSRPAADREPAQSPPAAPPAAEEPPVDPASPEA